MWVCGLDCVGLGQGEFVGSCECGNEHSGSTKCSEYLVQLESSYILKKCPAPWSKQVSKDLSKNTQRLLPLIA